MTDMTRYDMTCDTFAEQLADYLEGDASELVRGGVEAHAAGCGACAALLADLVALPLDASALPVLVPSRNLWSGIAERIDARVLPMAGGEPMHAVLSAPRDWSRLAMAAAALVLVSAGVTNWVTRASLSGSSAHSRTAGMRAAPAAAQVASVTPGVVDSGGAEDGVRHHAARGGRGDGERQFAGRPSRTPPSRAVAEVRGAAPVRLASATPVPVPVADPVYDRDITALRKIVRERRAQLDPATVAVLEQSVAVIDSAIAQSRAALARDPASRFLATQLNHSLEKKIELLRTAAMLPART